MAESKGDANATDLIVSFDLAKELRARRQAITKKGFDQYDIALSSVGSREDSGNAGRGIDDPCIHVHFGLLWPVFGDEKPKEFCATFHLGAMTHESLHFEERCTLKAELKFAARDGHERWNDDAVFVDIIEVSQASHDLTVRTPAMRLVSLDDCPVGIADTWDSLVALSLQDGGRACERVLDLPLLSSGQSFHSTWGDEFPSEMIERTPQIVKDLPKNKRQLRREMGNLGHVPGDRVPSTGIKRASRLGLINIDLRVGAESVVIKLESFDECRGNLIEVKLSSIEFGLRPNRT